VVPPSPKVNAEYDVRPPTSDPLNSREIGTNDSDDVGEPHFVVGSKTLVTVTENEGTAVCDNANERLNFTFGMGDKNSDTQYKKKLP